MEDAFRVADASEKLKASLNRRVWIFSVTQGNWEILIDHNVWALRREAAIRKIGDGDILIFYLKGSKPPCFVGAYEVEGGWRKAEDVMWEDELEARRIIYPYQIDVRPIQLGAARVEELLPQLSFIKNKDNWGVHLKGTPANNGKPISEEDYQIILNRLKGPPSPFSPRAVRGKPPSKPPIDEDVIKPSEHSELIRMLNEIGEALGFFVKAEEMTPDGAYRFDSTWRDYEGHAPIKVFEVEMSKNIDHALSSLAHAHDIWRSDQLWLVVSDEKSYERAKKLVDPRLRGAFSRLKRKLEILTGDRLKETYLSLSPHMDLVKRLSERSS